MCPVHTLSDFVQMSNHMYRKLFKQVNHFYIQKVPWHTAQHVFRLKIIKLHQRQTRAKYLTWYAFQDSFTTLWWVKSNFRTWRRRYRIRILSSNDKQSLYDSQGDKFSCIFPKITSYFWGLLNQVYNTSTINIKLLTLNNKMNLTPFFITK